MAQDYKHIIPNMARHNVRQAWVNIYGMPVPRGIYPLPYISRERAEGNYSMQYPILYRIKITIKGTSK